MTPSILIRKFSNYLLHLAHFSLWPWCFGSFAWNSKLPDYGNESELCMRLNKKGYRLVWTCRSYVHHYGQRSYGQVRSRDQIQSARLNSQVYIDSLHNT